MPNDTINNSIKKASGEGSNKEYEEITYEGYGPNGIAVIVEASTDKAGGNLGTTGCVSYLFNKKGVIVIDRTTTDMSEDDMMMLALDSGAEDFSADEECYEITTSPEDFSKVREALEAKNLEFVEAEVQMVPTTTVEVPEEAVEKVERLIDNLNDLDDVMNVYHNAENV